MTEVTGRVGEQRPRRYPPYPDYKESGVRWLGEIPATWNIAPVYARYEVALGKMLDAKRVTGDSSGQYLRNVDVQWDAVNIDGLPEMDFSPSDRNRYLLRRGDLLVCEGGEVGRTAIWDGGLDECYYQKAIHRVRPWSACDVPRFFYFLMYAMAKRGAFTAGGNPNTIDHLTAVQLRRYRVPIPMASEQRAIVAFLDRETAKIDALVARKERLIELLQEKRTALITRAVTRGLDPNAPMKDSGVEWLGEIPAHWDVVGSSMLFTHRKESALADDQQLTASQQHGVIPQRRFMELEGRSVVQVVTGTDILKHVEPNDFVISMRSFQGGLEHSNYRGCISSAYVIVRPSDRVDSGYFSYALKSATYIQALQSTSDLVRDGQALRFANFRRVPLPLVPLQEQKIVATYLDEHVAQLDRLCQATLRGIRLLKEFRTGLISAAVTGKIDVREAVPR